MYLVLIIEKNYRFDKHLLVYLLKIDILVCLQFFFVFQVRVVSDDYTLANTTILLVTIILEVIEAFKSMVVLERILEMII